jgi:hypothetical protein
MAPHNADRDSDVRIVERPVITSATDPVFSPPSSLEPDTHVLHLDCVFSPQARLQHWAETDVDRLAEVAIVHTGYAVDDATAVEAAGESLGIPTRFTYVGNPGDLSQVGLELVKFCDRTPTDDPTIVYVDSVSLLLQYSSVDAVVSFLERCLELFEQHDVSARLFLTPAVHDPETVKRLRSVVPE